MVDIIILKYNNPDYENETIQQVLNTVKMPYSLTVFDNFQKDWNLSTAWNRAIEKSDEETICLLNSDTVPEEGWLEKLVEGLKQPKAGAVGPISNCAGGHQGGHKEPMKEGTIQTCVTLSNFCVVFPKKIWEEVGGLDEAYVMGGEDSDFFMRVRRKGYELYTRFDTFVYHHGHKTIDNVARKYKDVDGIRKESAARYRSKAKL